MPTFFVFFTHRPLLSFFFFFNDTATTEIYTLSLHDALPIFDLGADVSVFVGSIELSGRRSDDFTRGHLIQPRSEEHTSELQSQSNLVCRLLLEKKKKKIRQFYIARDSTNTATCTSGCVRPGH